MIKLKSAWLVTWEYSADAAAVADEIAGILPRQWGSERVRWFVEWTYAAATSTVRELTSYAAQPSRNPYRAKEWRGRISCGHHPWLEARIVKNLNVDVDPDLFETISWKEPDRWRVDEESGQVIHLGGGPERSIVRRLRGSLSNEPIWDRMTGTFKPGWGPGEMPMQPYE